jgi:hypothetical protein
MAVYNLLSTAVPPLFVPTGLIDTTASDPATTVRQKLVPGASGAGSLTGPFNRNASRDDAQGRYGGGAYGVWTGLDLVAGTWPSFTVTAGQAGMDAPVTVPVDTSVSAADNQRNYVWLMQGGTVTMGVGSTAPPGPSVYLGSFNPASSVFDTPDYSGRAVQGMGNLLFVQTADAGKPAWTAPGGVRYFHRTAGGLYLWDGADYWLIASAPEP